MTTIMILGAGIMQMPGIRLAKASGWKVIVADGNKEAPGRSLADHFEAVDLKDRDGLLALARRYKELYGLDGVFTAGTDFSSSVAWVTEHMGLPGIPFATAMRATDKCLMREAFQAAGVPGPRFACISGPTDPVSVLGSLDFPLVVKPVDNMGARGVRKVESRESLIQACRSAIPLSRTSRVIIEEFMEGPELSLDAVVYKGRVTVCGNADRHIFFPPSFVEMGHTMPTCLDASTRERVEKVFEAGIHAIGIENGAAKGDIKLTRSGPMVGEIAARLSGGYMSGWTFPLSSGVEVTQAAMNIAVGLPPGDLSPRLENVVAERAFISLPGTVAAVTGEAEARKVPGVAEVFTRASVGDVVVFPANNVEKCGNILAVGKTRDAAVETARDALRLISIRLEPLHEATTSHLFRLSGNDAFQIMDQGFKAKLHSLPLFWGSPGAFRPDQPVQVLAIPGFEVLPARDWHGLLLGDAVASALQENGVLVDGAAPPGSFVLGGLFWKAILRGSAQGGRYLLESARKASRAGILDRFLAGL